MRIGLMLEEERRLSECGDDENKKKAIEHEYQMINFMLYTERVLDDTAKCQNITKECKALFETIEQSYGTCYMDVPEQLINQYKNTVAVIIVLRDDLRTHPEYFKGSNLSRLGRKRIRQATENYKK